MGIKQSLKDTKIGLTDPVGGIKSSAKHIKDKITPNQHPDTSAQDAVLEQQKLAQAALDSEENRRRKRLLSAATGIRAFRGSPLFRAAPADNAGRAASAAAAVSGGGGSGSGAASYTGSTSGYYAGRSGGGRSLIN